MGILITVAPNSQRAKNRVKEHGSRMLLLKEDGDKFLVESIGRTFNKNTEKWMGWFSVKEATFTKEP